MCQTTMDANEAARFHAISNSVCSSPMTSAHATCPVHCYLFGGDCGMGARVSAFQTDMTGRISAEGICGANMCYTDGHCGAMFDPNRRYMSVGFAGNGKSNGVDFLYVDKGTEPTYPIPIATHYDQRIKINSAYLNPNSNFLVFEAIYYHPTIPATADYVVYKAGW